MEEQNPFIAVAKILAEASDNVIATPLAEECREFIAKESTHEEGLLFLRNLRDKAVHCGGASSLVMTVFSAVLNAYPEPEEERKARIAKLEAQNER